MTFDTLDPFALRDIMFGGSIVWVKKEEDFGVPVGGVVTLAGGAAGKTWILCASFTMNSTIKPTGIVRITDASNGSYILFMDADVAFQSDNFNRLEFTNTDVRTSRSDNKLFDLTGLGLGTAVAATEQVFVFFSDLGNVDNTGLISWSNMAFVNYDTGLTFTDGQFVPFNIINFRPNVSSNTTAMSFSGTWTRSINLQSLDANVFGNDGAILNFDSGGTYPAIKIDRCNANITGSGSFYAVGSLDSTSVVVNATTNTPGANSNVLGEFSMFDNVTATVIAAQNTPVKIAGTTVAGNLERFTHTNGKLTYIGLEDITIRVRAVGAVISTAGIEDVKFTTYIAKNQVVEPDSKFTKTVGAAVGAPPVDFFPESFISLVTDDELEVFVENNGADNENITFDSLKLLPGK